MHIINDSNNIVDDTFISTFETIFKLQANISFIVVLVITHVTEILFRHKILRIKFCYHLFFNSFFFLLHTLFFFLRLKYQWMSSISPNLVIKNTLMNSYILTCFISCQLLIADIMKWCIWPWCHHFVWLHFELMFRPLKLLKVVIEWFLWPICVDWSFHS